jgi:hypothetical protein
MAYAVPKLSANLNISQAEAVFRCVEAGCPQRYPQFQGTIKANRALPPGGIAERKAVLAFSISARHSAARFSLRVQGDGGGADKPPRQTGPD